MLYAKTAEIAKSAKKTIQIDFFFALFALFAIFASPAFGAPATTQADSTVSPQAAAVLEKVKQAYTKLTSLEQAGRLTGEFDVDGQQQQEKLDFAATFSAPNLFRLEIGKDDQIGSTGQRMYVFLKKRNMYFAADGPKERVAWADLPEPFADLISSQDPSLALAISSDPAAELAKQYASIDMADDVKVGETSCTALKLKGREGRGLTTMLFDPSTHLLRRVSIDLSPQLLKRGAGEVKKAQVTIDYPASKADAAMKPGQFAWVPPPGARDAAEISPGGRAEALVGKPAHAFKLPDLTGKEVALADHKGQVVVLDFWATWCGPCVMSLPKLDHLSKEMKDAGVKFYAVNIAEEKELVAGFMASKHLTIPVLLDSDSKVAGQYLVEGIPQTVVIGKDGIVRKVFVGAGPDIESKLREAINASLNASK